MLESIILQTTEEDYEFEVEFEVSEYRAATLLEPEEFPEIEITSVVDISTGEEISDDLYEELYDFIVEEIENIIEDGELNW